MQQQIQILLSLYKSFSLKCVLLYGFILVFLNTFSHLPCPRRGGVLFQFAMCIFSQQLSLDSIRSFMHLGKLFLVEKKYLDTIKNCLDQDFFHQSLSWIARSHKFFLSQKTFQRCQQSLPFPQHPKLSFSNCPSSVQEDLSPDRITIMVVVYIFNVDFVVV